MPRTIACTTARTVADDMPTTWMGDIGVAGVAEVLPMRMGSRAALALLDAVGLGARARAVFDGAARGATDPATDPATNRAAHPTAQRVADAELRALHRALRDTLGLPEARAVARDAGTRAADHLMAHHLPRAWQRLLRHLPAPLAARLLWRVLQPHAWTFAGDGQLALQPGRPWVLSIRGNPLCRGVLAAEPGCDFVSALLERLFRVLVHPRCQVVETACEACGAPACRFELRW